eukprot:5532187-Prymnesium_polylepis.1
MAPGHRETNHKQTRFGGCGPFRTRRHSGPWCSAPVRASLPVSHHYLTPCTTSTRPADPHSLHH